MRKKLSGLHYGKVSDNNDPKKDGRVKVSIEGLGKKIVTDWIPIAGLYSSKDCGGFFIPEIGDQVVIGFLGHSEKDAVVFGSVWSQKNKPPVTGENGAADLNKNGKNSVHFFRSKKGNKIILDDTAGKEKVQFVAAGDQNRIDMCARDQSISFTANNILISALKGISVEAEEGNLNFQIGSVTLSEGLTFNADNNINIQSAVNLTIQGEKVKMNS